MQLHGGGSQWLVRLFRKQLFPVHIATTKYFLRNQIIRSILTSSSNFSRRVLMSSCSFCSLTFHSALCTSRLRSFSMSREWRWESSSNTRNSFRLLVQVRQKKKANRKRIKLRASGNTGTSRTNFPHSCISGLQVQWPTVNRQREPKLLSVVIIKKFCRRRGSYYLKAYQPIMGILCCVVWPVRIVEVTSLCVNLRLAGGWTAQCYSKSVCSFSPELGFGCFYCVLMSPNHILA